jgi:hypothetical protein
MVGLSSTSVRSVSFVASLHAWGRLPPAAMPADPPGELDTGDVHHCEPTPSPTLACLLSSANRTQLEGVSDGVARMDYNNSVGARRRRSRRNEARQQ